MGHSRVEGWALKFILKNIPGRIGSWDHSKIASHILTEFVEWREDDVPKLSYRALKSGAGTNGMAYLSEICDEMGKGDMNILMQLAGPAEGASAYEFRQSKPSCTEGAWWAHMAKLDENLRVAMEAIWHQVTHKTKHRRSHTHERMHARFS